MSAATIRVSGKESPERSAPTPTSGGPGSSSTIRIWLVVAATAATAGGLIAIVLQHVEVTPGDLQIPWWAIALMFAVGELCAVHLEFRRESHTFTLSELALVAGLLFATPLSLLAGRLVGASLLLAHDRRRPIKVAFNLSLFALETAVAIGVFHLVTRQIETFTPLTLAGVFAATFAASLMGVGLIFVVISISEGSFELSRLGPASAVGLTITAANTSIALVAAEAFKHSSTSVLLLAVPAAVVFVAYRALVGARDKHSRLAFLHETSTLVARSPKLETAMQDVLVRTCSMFRAEVAELLLLTPEDARAGLRMVVRSEDDRPDFHDVELGSDELTFRVLAERRPILVRRGEATDALLGHLPGLELKDAIVVPVSGEEALLGVLLVGNRLGDVSTFSRDDVRLVETLASQLGVSLENARLGKSLGRLTELSAQLQHQAFHDPLTGLANRVLFTEKLELALARQKRMQSRLAVLFVDIDDFKAVNDLRGHEAGDALLSAVADRLRGCLREVDTPARLGGDEFALLLEELADDEDAIAVAQRIVDSFADPVDIDGTPASVSVSIGVALAADAISAERILNDSDIAMYRAKARGKAQFTVFEPSMRVELLAPIEMRVNLRHAFSRGELSLRYQPVVSLTTSRLEGVEALMRWQRSATEAIPPNEFIPVAEECGLIAEIGGWALREACRQRAAWKVAGEQEIEPWVSVNVSRRQLERDSFVDEVSEALQESGLDPHLLVLEITETIALRDDSGLPLLPVLEQLKGLGVRIALDDFGSGYAAFSVLQTLPLDILKLDRHFVESIGSKPQATELTRTIVEVARTFGLVTIAEGAERRDQLDVLSSLGCDLAQGFLFSSPLDGQGIEALLRQQALGHWFTALDPTSVRRLRVVDGGRRSA